MGKSQKIRKRELEHRISELEVLIDVLAVDYDERHVGQKSLKEIVAEVKNRDEAIERGG